MGLIRYGASGIILSRRDSTQRVAIISGQGAPGASEDLDGATFGVYIRENATTPEEAIYVSIDGTSWFLSEPGKPISLAAAAESGDNIDVTVTGPARAAQYIARIYDASMDPLAAAAFTLAEVGDGAEVSTTAKAGLLFTTAADGDATLRVHDVSGGSGATLYLFVSPASVQAGGKAGPEAVVALTFD